MATIPDEESFSDLDVPKLDQNGNPYYVRTTTSEQKEEMRLLREEIADMYYERDHYKWSESIKKKNFIQHTTQKPGIDSIMIKARTTIKTTSQMIRQVTCNVYVR